MYQNVATALYPVSDKRRWGHDKGRNKMTVLQRQTAGGVDSQRLRKNLIAVAMAVVGVGAAFGISQVMDSTSQSSEIQARIEAGAAYGAALDQAAELRARYEAGQAYGAGLEASRASVGSAAMAAHATSLTDELEAIRGGQMSVGSDAISENSNSLGWELERINGGGTTSSDAETAVKSDHNFR